MSIIMVMALSASLAKTQDTLPQHLTASTTTNQEHDNSFDINSEFARANQLYREAKELYDSAEYNKAVVEISHAVEIHERIFREDPQNKANKSSFASTANLLCLCALKLGQFSEAIYLGENVAQLFKFCEGEKSYNYGVALHNLSVYHGTMGDAKTAIDYGHKALEIIPEDNHLYTKILGEIAKNHIQLGEYPQVVKYASWALEREEREKGENSDEYTKYLGFLSEGHANIGDHQLSLELAKRRLELIKSRYGESSSDYAIALNDLAVRYYGSGNIEEGVLLMMEASNILFSTFGIFNKDYQNTVLNVCHFLTKNPELYFDNKLFLDFLNMVGTYILKTKGENSKEFARMMTYLANYYTYTHDLEKALKCFEYSIYTYRKVQDESFEYINAIEYAGLISLLQKEFQKTANYAKEEIGLVTKEILSKFADLPENQRSLFWNRFKTVLEDNIHYYAFECNIPDLYEYAYNAALLSKGILLNTETEMRKLILESNDAETINLYENLLIQHKMIDFQLSLPVEERTLNLDSLTLVKEKTELRLVEKSKNYGNYTSNLRMDWKKVRDKLGKNDKAIEFVTFTTRNGSKAYVALVLGSEYERPHFYKLFESSELEKLIKGKSVYSLYNNKDLSKLIWGPLSEEIEKAQNVYFSPVGELYRIAIESLSDYRTDDVLSIGDSHKFHRLSSTRELALARDENATNMTAIYGGVKFDTDTTTLIQNSHRYAPVERSLDIAEIADSLNLRGGVAPLSGTLKEANYLNEKLAAHRSQKSIYTDAEATEGSFKALSGKSYTHLHIGTHGFYWTEKEAAMQRQLDFLAPGSTSPKSVEDKALSRSGLLFAGANNSLSGIKLPPSVDDGILTAKEIAQLDFRSLDLVVLSACQTGLGDISGEGVFGLQRGFKKSGANTLMMSLWKVDDDATLLLMQKFYDNLIDAKMSKADALRDAQKYVREFEKEETIDLNEQLDWVEKRRLMDDNDGILPTNIITRKIRPYEDPRFWAAWIMLDAIH